ncbi:hypothetical protein F5B17DRAFT_113666 [Nemania serpens]|nr:hypothetical protein F5B17DRAFT_113666 [Nemania serpens]
MKRIQVWHNVYIYNSYFFPPLLAASTEEAGPFLFCLFFFASRSKTIVSRTLPLHTHTHTHTERERETDTEREHKRELGHLAFHGGSGQNYDAPKVSGFWQAGKMGVLLIELFGNSYRMEVELLNPIDLFDYLSDYRSTYLFIYIISTLCGIAVYF